MISLQIRHYNQITFSCPHCGVTMRVVNMASRMCMMCFKPIPNFFALLYDKKSKIEWHRMKGGLNA